jgi:NADPH:quinone reductase-like Zn-dependent oxidoreductase
MRAVTVEQGHIPRFDRFEAPVADAGRAVVSVRAAALTNLDVLIAEGRHYFSPTRWPVVVGREAVVVAPDGRRLYLTVQAIPTPFGSMAEQTLADLSQALPVPADIEDAAAAALGNPGLAGWLALAWRAALRPGETVLILGATGASGMIAVAAAAALGAGRIVAAGRNRAALEQARALGAHETVALDAGDLVSGFRAAAPDGVDVVVDYLNGTPAEAALQVMTLGARMVQIGAPLGRGIQLDAQAARRQSIDVLGFAYYHAPLDAQRAAYAAVCGLARAGRAGVAIDTLPLSGFATAWRRHRAGGAKRQVLLP